MIESLNDIGKKHGTDKVQHGFLPFYEKFINPFRTFNVNVLEVGVFYGSSIRMWDEYFTNGDIYAADWWEGKQGAGHSFTDPKTFLEESKNMPKVRIVNLDQSSIENLKRVVEQLNDVYFDLILDDGSHLMRDQQITFAYLWDLVKPGGFYSIEDIHTSNEDVYDVKPNKSNSTLEMLYRYNSTGIISSEYMTDSQATNIMNSIDGQIEIHFSSPNSGTCIIRKK